MKYFDQIRSAPPSFGLSGSGREKWRKTTCLLAFLALFLLFPGMSAIGQQQAKGKATIDASFNVSLEAGSGLSSDYLASISQLGFTNEADAKAFFGKLSDNMVDFRLDYATQKVIIHFLPQPEGAVQMDDFQNQSKVLEMKFRNYRESLKNSGSPVNSN